MKKKVIVAGHICLDITPVFTGQEAGEVSKMLVPGRLIQTGGADVHTGGAVANTGLAMKILGVDVTLMGKIGADAFGKIVTDILCQYQAEQGLMVSEKEATSYSVVIAIPGVDRIFLHNPGANDTFSSGDINYGKVREADLFHFGYPPLMKRMYSDNGRELEEMFRRVKQQGTVTSLDLAAVDVKSEAGAADWEGILKKTLPYTDFFVPSVEELCFMIDRSRYEEWSSRAEGRDITEGISPEDVEPLAWKAISMGAKAVLIKCGASGMYYKTASAEQMEPVCTKLGLDIGGWSDKEGFEKSFVPDRILSGAGAGDTSIAAFLTSMLEGCGVEEAVRMAAATGACCVATYDALSGLQPLESLKGRISRGWAKNEPAGNGGLIC